MNVYLMNRSQSIVLYAKLYFISQNLMRKEFLIKCLFQILLVHISLSVIITIPTHTPAFN